MSDPLALADSVGGGAAMPVPGQGGYEGLSDPAGQHTWFERFGLLGAVCAVHLALLWWVTETLSHSVQTTPPTVVGMLVSAPVSEPVPLPAKPIPKPQPRPVVRPKPIPPPPEAPPSERAVTPPPEPPPTLAETEPEAPSGPPPEPVSEAKEPVDPITLPRSDASQLNNPTPVYPPVSHRLGEQGRVLCDVYILADGTVGQIKLRRSSGFSRLDQAALEAVRHWRYLPARRGNQPIPYWYVQPIEFLIRH